MTMVTAIMGLPVYNDHVKLSTLACTHNEWENNVSVGTSSSPKLLMPENSPIRNVYAVRTIIFQDSIVLAGLPVHFCVNQLKSFRAPSVT